MMACIISSSYAAASSTTRSLVSADSLPTHSTACSKPTSLAWVSSFPCLNISITNNSLSLSPNPTLNKNSFIQAAWTRRSRGELAKKPNRKS